MKISRIDHLGIAVQSIEEVLPYYENVLGLKCYAIEEVADQKVKTAFLPLKGSAPCSELELLEPTSDDSPIAKFMEKNNGRGGMHHVALRVDDLEAALAELKSKGVRLIDEKPRKGAGGAMIAFIHPAATGGVLLELSQR